jgi:hypothetical protein
MKTIEMEIRLANWFNFRQNLIVPRVSWGFMTHECDLLIVSSVGYLTEVEIKISKNDLKKDKDKSHGHESGRIKTFYFAVPEELEKYALESIPERAGLIIVPKDKRFKPFEVKKPIINIQAKPITSDDKYKIARLGALRIWGLKEKIIFKDKILSKSP